MLDTLKQTAFVRLFGLTKVPVLFYIGPKVIKLDDSSCEIMVPLKRRTKNHLNSMYFGVLACGADLAGGLMAMQLIRQSGRNIALVFKDFKADFLKRAEGDTHFICNQGQDVANLVKKTIESGERENLTLEVIAYVPKKLGKEPAAKFSLTLSLKDKGPK